MMTRIILGFAAAKPRSKSVVFSAVAALFSVAIGLPAHAQTVTGQWEFNGDYTAQIGSAITGINGTWNFATEAIGGESAQVAQFAAGTSTATDPFLTIVHGVAANGGSRANRYTILMDVRLAPVTGFVSLYQTDVTNASDGDWFVRGDRGMGISGDYTDAGNATRFADNVWNRIALTIDTTTAAGSTESTVYRSYVDGVLQNVVASPSGWGADGRYSLDLNSFLLFADEDRETSSGAINALQVRDYAMSAAEIAALGGAKASGFVVATVVPEAGTLALVLPVILGVAALRRRK